MAERKKIPCRVCGKLFEPCSYCQSHSDVFRWRNFACSRGCATKYINDTIIYRESLKSENANSEILGVDAVYATPSNNKGTAVKRKYNKKISIKPIENKINIENSKTN